MIQQILADTTYIHRSAESSSVHNKKDWKGGSKFIEAASLCAWVWDMWGAQHELVRQINKREKETTNLGERQASPAQTVEYQV